MNIGKGQIKWGKVDRKNWDCIEDALPVPMGVWAQIGLGGNVGYNIAKSYGLGDGELSLELLCDEGREHWL